MTRSEDESLNVITNSTPMTMDRGWMRFLGGGVRRSVLIMLLSGMVSGWAEVPGMIHYQGHVAVNGTSFSGGGWFKFALVDRGGTNTFWSHDGSSVGGAAPASEIHLTVVAGLYSVLLGDRSVAGMTEVLRSEVFEDPAAVYLRVWFNDGVNGSQLLAPDTRIASVGYALVAARVADGALTDAAFKPHVNLGGDGTAGTVTLLSGGDQVRAVLDAGPQSGQAALSLYDVAGNFATVRLVGAELDNAGAQLLLRNGAGRTTLEFDAQDGSSTNAGGVIRLKRPDGTTAITLLGKETDDNPLIEFGALLELANSTGQIAARLSGGAGGDQGSLTLLSREQVRRVELDAGGNSDGGSLQLRGRSGNNPKVLLEGDGGENQGKLILRAGDDLTRVSLDGDGPNNGGEVQVFDADGTATVSIRGAAGLTNGASLQLRRADGTPTITLAAEANGEGRITTQVLQITGGSDLSEQFDINAPAADLVAPGAIVCIDPEHPGNLHVSDRAYDTTVAGVLSGAGGVKPGMLMGQPGTAADGRHPVALAGRVYCQVDASYGAIRPGDLVTTSPTPGHGMKADPARAGGAILGKAMTPLASGRGLVLVLVSLQ